MTLILHPILQQSFATIDDEIGPHHFSADQYAVVRRVIHSTADFEFQHLLHFSPGVIPQATAALAQGKPIVTDVNMVTVGIQSVVRQTFHNPVITAVDAGQSPAPGQTRTASGMLQCFQDYPDAIYVIGNAPTALIALCQQIQRSAQQLALVIGVPVGFIGVIEAKTALAQLSIPQIRIEGRKGGSPAAAAIVNALLTLAWQQRGQQA
ncbi:cobalt-precorrin-8X methylmutase [Acaryochloris sp. IP29b_bin.148]|uniref:cobalt-precorrin-8X methylmutase n=1 Tax=Acaryochloris sp. IP29b_bin.148 TaxID=2969218 RepID=UPI0026048D61|nr:cobalt-precorrin-8X methylmutase [Acaryochloris sp. IP29b_bin.148]